MMRILINASNIHHGGALQVALSFINMLPNLTHYTFDYKIIASDTVYDSITNTELQAQCTIIPYNPAKIRTRHKYKMMMNQIVASFRADIVFTIFGPSYWRPSVSHIMGFALVWMINPQSDAYFHLSFKQRIKMKLLNHYKKNHIKKDADYYIVETQDAKDRLCKQLKIDSTNCVVVGNATSLDQYSDQELPIAIRNKLLVDGFKLITIAHHHPNKNLKMIALLAQVFKDRNIAVRFFVTLNEDIYQSLFSKHQDYVINLGTLPTTHLKAVYQYIDAMFLPTLLEIFSASYPEAMAMGKPILTSDRSFAREICQNAALYFNPIDPADIADKVLMILNDQALRKKLVEEGKARLSAFETPASRANKYLKTIQSVVQQNL